MTIYYHISPTKNRRNIQRFGVEPLFSRGRQKASWWVTKEALMWAVAHCSARHSVSVDKLDIWTVNVSGALRGAKNTRWAGVFYTTCRIKPDSMSLAIALIDQDHERENKWPLK